MKQKSLLLEEAAKVDPQGVLEDYQGESELLAEGNPVFLQAKRIITKEIKEWAIGSLNAVIGEERVDGLVLKIGPSYKVGLRFLENRVVVDLNGVPLPASKVYGASFRTDGSGISRIDVDLASLKKTLLNALTRRN